MGRECPGKGKRDAPQRSATCQGLGSIRRVCAGKRLNSTGANSEASDWPLGVEGHLPGRGGGPTALSPHRLATVLGASATNSSRPFFKEAAAFRLHTAFQASTCTDTGVTCVRSAPGVHSVCSGVSGFARAVRQPAGAQSDRKAVKQSGDRRNRLRSKNSIVCRDGVVRHGGACCARVLGCVPIRRSSDQVRRSRRCSLMPFHNGATEIGVQGQRALPRPGFSGL